MNSANMLIFKSFFILVAMTTWTSRIQYIRYGSSSGTSPPFQEGAVWLQVLVATRQQQLRNQLI